MAPTFNFLAVLLLPIFLGVSSLAVPMPDTAISPITRGTPDKSPRSTNTCADPSLTRTIFQGFSGTKVAHVIAPHDSFVNSNSQQGTGPAFWTMQGPVFKGWTTQQESTVPLFRMTSSTGLDFVFMTGADAQTPPIVAGFTAVAITAWVYNTAICGSVPLMSANLAAQTDHYYTTDSLEHASLLADGWTDSGVVAFVLPLPTW